MQNIATLYNDSSYTIVYNVNYKRILNIRQSKKMLQPDDKIEIPLKNILLRMEFITAILDHKKIRKYAATPLEIHICDTLNYQYSYAGVNKIFIQSDEIGDAIVETAQGHTVLPLAKLCLRGAPRKNKVSRTLKGIIVGGVVGIGFGIAGIVGYIVSH